jgi:hypothetical protein
MDADTLMDAVDGEMAAEEATESMFFDTQGRARGFQFRANASKFASARKKYIVQDVEFMRLVKGHGSQAAEKG